MYQCLAPSLNVKGAGRQWLRKSETSAPRSAPAFEKYRHAVLGAGMLGVLWPDPEGRRGRASRRPTADRSVVRARKRRRPRRHLSASTRPRGRVLSWVTGARSAWTAEGARLRDIIDPYLHLDAKGEDAGFPVRQSMLGRPQTLAHERSSGKAGFPLIKLRLK